MNLGWVFERESERTWTSMKTWQGTGDKMISGQDDYNEEVMSQKPKESTHDALLTEQKLNC